MASDKERIKGLEVRMDHVEEGLEKQESTIAQNHGDLKDELYNLNEGQRGFDTSIRELGKDFKNHVDRGQQRRSDRWSWLRYLIFPAVLAIVYKALEYFAG